MTFFYYINTKNNNNEFRKTMKHLKVEYEQKNISLFDIKYTLINIIEKKMNSFLD